MERYNIRASDGTETGAILVEEVKTLIEQGKVKGTSMIYTEGSQKWRLAASIPEIRDLIREFDPTQDKVLDRIRTEGAESHTIIIKARREAHMKEKMSFWSRIFGGSKKKE